MTEVELSRKAGVLVAYLNQEAVERLFAALKKSISYDTLQEPYKTWLSDHSAIPTKDLRDNAKKATQTAIAKAVLLLEQVAHKPLVVRLAQEQKQNKQGRQSRTRKQIVTACAIKPLDALMNLDLLQLMLKK